MGNFLWQIVRINLSLFEEYFKLTFIICTILLGFSIYYLFLKKKKSNNEKLELLKQKYDYQIKSLDDIKVSYNELKKLRHDLQNNMFCILGLLEQKKYVNATEYAIKLSRKIEEIKVFSFTDNEAVNCMINLKMKTAKDNGIDFKCNVDRKLGEINEVDVCMLIANLLDNAIEACQELDSKRKIIEFEIHNKNKELLVIVKNSINKSVLKNNPNLITNKKDGSLHGIGKLSIKSIVKKYHGNLSYYEKDGYFGCMATMANRCTNIATSCGVPSHKYA